MWFFLPDEFPALALIEVKGQSSADIQNHRHKTGVASAFLAMGQRGWDLQLLRFHFNTIHHRPLRCKNSLTGSKPVRNGHELITSTQGAPLISTPGYPMKIRPNPSAALAVQTKCASTLTSRTSAIGSAPLDH